MSYDTSETNGIRPVVSGDVGYASHSLVDVAIPSAQGPEIGAAFGLEGPLNPKDTIVHSLGSDLFFRYAHLNRNFLQDQGSSISIVGVRGHYDLRFYRGISARAFGGAGVAHFDGPNLFRDEGKGFTASAKSGNGLHLFYGGALCAGSGFACIEASAGRSFDLLRLDLTIGRIGSGGASYDVDDRKIAFRLNFDL